MLAATAADAAAAIEPKIAEPAERAERRLRAQRTRTAHAHTAVARAGGGI
eukprot:SAG11_NODE_12677_length_691_cov_1.027027_1_plen_49_part_10